MPRLIAAAVLLMLAACGDRERSEAQVVAEGEKLVKPLPGLYRSTTTLTGFELSGADPKVADDMRDRLGQVSPQRREYCLTPEEAARGFEDLVRQTQHGNCDMERFVANDTRLSARLSCRAGEQMTSKVTMEGNGAPDSSHIALEIVQAGPAVPGGTARIAMEIENRRIGDCPPGNPGR